jgi:hypothetical protein
MINRAELIKEFGSDDRSVDFSVDPDMYTKLGIKKTRKGEEKMSEIQKLYDYQLEKDIKKIVQVRGTYQHRNSVYLRIRDRDPLFHEIAKVSTFANDGNFTEINYLTKEHHWESTTQPYGIHAHKRYMQFVKGLPTGPTNAEIKDKLQRELDATLIENVL